MNQPKTPETAEKTEPSAYRIFFRTLGWIFFALGMVSVIAAILAWTWEGLDTKFFLPLIVLAIYLIVSGFVEQPWPRLGAMLMTVPAALFALSLIAINFPHFRRHPEAALWLIPYLLMMAPFIILLKGWDKI